jgi:superkiller protein 3
LKTKVADQLRWWWWGDKSITQDPENLTAINALAGMGILTDDDSLIDAALSELISLPLDLRHRRDPQRDFSYILMQHHLGQVRHFDLHSIVKMTGDDNNVHFDPQGNLTAALSQAQMAVHAEPAREDSRRTLATLLLQCGEPAIARPVISQGCDTDIGELRKSIGLRTVAMALFEDKQSVGEAWSLVQKGLMLAPWDQRSWKILAYMRNRH